MPKTKSRTPQTSDTKEARLIAAQSFIKGDRVRHKITGKIGQFDSINLGFALPEVWVQFETDTEIRVPISCNPLELELVERCNDSTQFSVAVVVEAACATGQLEKSDEITSNKSPSSLSCIPLDERSEPDTTHTSQGITTSETSVQSESSISSAMGLHARESVEPMPTKEDSTTSALDSGTNCSDSSTSANPNSSSGTLAVLPDTPNHDSDTQLLDEFSGVLPQAGMMQNGQLSVQPHSERPTRGNGYSLLPTPMVHSRASESYRNPGQDKLEQKLREMEIGVIPPGHVSHPAVREYMMGFPEGWTNITQPDGGQLTLPLATSASPNEVSPIEQKEPHPLDTRIHPNRPHSLGDESDISPNCFNPGMRVWSERRIMRSGEPDEVIRMTGVVVRTTSRQIVPNQSSNAPIDTPLVEVQWDGAKSMVLLSPGEVHMEASDEQSTSDTPEHCDQDAVVPEVVEELTFEESAERYRLELNVERAFYEAGCALRSLRDKRLYRSTHRTFEEYCRDRFGFTRRSSDYLIAGSLVVDNLKTRTNSSQILPSSETQCRPLTKLEPEQQFEVWQQAVEQSGGKVPTARIVKGIVERLKERDLTPPPIPYSEGDVVEIRAGVNPSLRKHDGCWGIVTHVGTWNCTVHISVRNVNVQCLADEMDRVDPKYTADIQAVSERIAALMQRDDLSRMAMGILEILGQQSCFSPDDLWFLEKVEQRYGIT